MMRIALIIAFLQCLSYSYSGVYKPEGKLFCIITGINEYPYPFPVLEGCVSDAITIKSKLNRFFTPANL